MFSLLHKMVCNFREKTEVHVGPLFSNYLSFFLNANLINNIIKNTHTIKSPNTTMNVVPPATNMIIEITATAKASKHNVINNIII